MRVQLLYAHICRKNLGDVHVVVFWSTAKKCTEIRAARISTNFFFPIMFLFFGVVVAVAEVVA